MENPSYDYKYLDPQVFIPAGGQGIMAVEAREGSHAAMLCQAIDNREGRLCLCLERMVLKLLDAGCHEPIGIYSQITDGRMKVWGISRPETSQGKSAWRAKLRTKGWKCLHSRQEGD